MKYEIKKEVKENIIEMFKNVLDENEYEWSTFAIEKIIDNYEVSKDGLLALLSKHPKWNPDKLMIRFESDYSRKINTMAIVNFTDFIYDKISNKDNFYYSDEYNIWDFVRYNIQDQFFNETMDDAIAKVNEINNELCLRNNMKSSKAIGKICRVMGWDKLPNYNREYAKLCDALNPIKVTRHTCISLNPIDFLLMSNGNSWKSCHDIRRDYDDDPGCYSSGTISYMLDECSFIFYTVDADFNGDDIELEPKLQRQVFGYNDEVFVQSRLYPQSMDYGAEEIYTDIRNIVQKVIADCIEKPNLWKKSKSNVTKIVYKGRGATCYPDWNPGCPGASHCSISTLKEKDNENVRIVLGSKPICIECGNTHDEERNINCCRAHYATCEGCGCAINSEDDVYYVGDYSYCRDCVSWCEDCDSYELSDDMHEVYYYCSGRIYSQYVCESCFENRYEECKCCGKHFHKNDMYYTDEGDYFCRECEGRYNGFEECQECGDYHNMDNMNYDEETGNYYCDDCYDELCKERHEEFEEEYVAQ